MGQLIVDHCLNGYNSTLFAYGQTGAGKTFSLVGKLDDPHQFGIIPRAGMYLFKSLEKKLENEELKDYQVTMNSCEIYLSKIRDLLKPTKTELRVRTRRDRTTYVDGIFDIYVHNMQEVF